MTNNVRASLAGVSLEAARDHLSHFGTRGMKWGVRKDLLGVSDLGPGQGGGVLAKPGAPRPTDVEGRKAMAGTHYVRSAMMDRHTGVGRPGGELATLNARHAGKDILGNPAHKQAYQKDMSDSLTKFAKAHAPKGADARVYVRGDGVLLIVGDKKAIDQFEADAIKHAEADVEKLMFKVLRDDKGFIIGLIDDSVEHSEAVDAFLEHHGIKGMRWGVRRSPQQLESQSSSGSAKDGEDGVERIAPGHTGGTGNPHLSADAERAVTIMRKPTSQMSDRELKEATNRAKQLSEYNKLFGGGDKSPLEQRVEELKLQKQYRDLVKEMTPEKHSAAKKFVHAVGTGFSAYQTIDKTLGGNLSKSLTRKLGLDVPMSLKDKIKADNEIKALKKVNVKNTAELNEAIALYGKIARGDGPSLATGYSGAGKRRASVGKDKKGSPYDSGPRQADDNASYEFPK